MRPSGKQYIPLCNYYAFKVLKLNYIPGADIKDLFDEFVAENGI